MGVVVASETSELEAASLEVDEGARIDERDLLKLATELSELDDVLDAESVEEEMDDVVAVVCAEAKFIENENRNERTRRDSNRGR